LQALPLILMCIHASRYGAPFWQMRGFVCDGWDAMQNAEGDLSSGDSNDLLAISLEDFDRITLVTTDTVVVIEGGGERSEQRAALWASAQSCGARVISLSVGDADAAAASRCSNADIVVRAEIPLSHLAIELGHRALEELSVKWMLNALSTAAQVSQGLVLGNSMISCGPVHKDPCC